MCPVFWGGGRVAEASWVGEWRRRFWADWEGNRRLTLAVARAFPGESLWARQVPAMRPFGELLEEVLSVERFFTRGLGENVWTYEPVRLERALPWPTAAAVRGETDAVFHGIAEASLAEVTPDPTGWGLPPQSHMDRLQYLLENEIHHRGQGYVYLRLLGVEPPLFYRRD